MVDLPSQCKLHIKLTVERCRLVFLCSIAAFLEVSMEGASVGILPIVPILTMSKAKRRFGSTQVCKVLIRCHSEPKQIVIPPPGKAFGNKKGLKVLHDDSLRVTRIAAGGAITEILRSSAGTPQCCVLP